MVSEFKKFVLRGNVVDLAIGFTVGAAFTTVARSVVDDLIMPPVGLLVGSVEFKDMFLVLRDGVPPGPYLTLAAAQEAGAATMNYGLFVNSVIALLLVGIAMFLIVRTVNRLDATMDRRLDGGEAPPEEPAFKKCPYCRDQIAFRAVRCPSCTSRLEGFESVADRTGGPTTAEG